MPEFLDISKIEVDRPSEISMHDVTKPDALNAMPSFTLGHGLFRESSASLRFNAFLMEKNPEPALPRLPVTAIRSPGLAPFRSRIPFFETNPRAVPQRTRSSCPFVSPPTMLVLNLRAQSFIPSTICS